MEVWQAQLDLAQMISEKLMAGREDADSAADELATGIRTLIESVIEDKTGAC